MNVPVLTLTWWGSLVRVQSRLPTSLTGRQQCHRKPASRRTGGACGHKDILYGLIKGRFRHNPTTVPSLSRSDLYVVTPRVCQTRCRRPAIAGLGMLMIGISNSTQRVIPSRSRCSSQSNGSGPIRIKRCAFNTRGDPRAWTASRYPAPERPSELPRSHKLRSNLLPQRWHRHWCSDRRSVSRTTHGPSPAMRSASHPAPGSPPLLAHAQSSVRLCHSASTLLVPRSTSRPRPQLTDPRRIRWRGDESRSPVAPDVR